MKRLPPCLHTACGMLALSLALGCTAQVGDVAMPGTGSAPGGTGGISGTGAGPSGTGNVTGSGGASGTGATPGGGTTGSTGGSGVGGAVVGGTGGAAGPGGAGVVADPNTAGVRPLRLMTRREYLNTVRDLLTDTSMTAAALPPEDEDPESSFVFHTPGTVSSQEAMLYRDAAEALAKAAVGRMATLLPCATGATTAAAETTCLDTFMTTLAIKLYRRPLSTTGTGNDKERLTAMFTAGKALGLTFPNAIGFVIETVLQSPEFLYHWEVDPVKAVTEPVPGGTPVVKLGSYELANRLSYALWGTMPDTMLFAAAAANQLGDVASVDTQVRRMLKDTKASGTVADFFMDWMDVDGLADRPKDATIYPMYNDALTSAMEAEIQSFATSIVVSGSGRFDDLMTGTNSFANQALATVYGVTGVTGTALKAVMLNPAQRSGLLTSAAFMSLTGSSSGSHAPRRGKAVFYKFLCGTLPPLMIVPPEPAAPSAGGTTRQRFEALTKNACATACHNVLDPLGYAFENYDGIGQYRSMDNGMPVNASTMVTLDGQTKAITDARGLAAALAGSEQAQACFTKQWFRYALGRLDTPQDQASINGAMTTFKAATRDVRELLVGMATSRTFRYRTPGTSEILP